MGLKRITTKDGDVYFLDSASKERIKTPLDNIQSELGKEMIGKLRCYEYISLIQLIFSYQGRIGRTMFFLYGIVLNITFYTLIILIAVNIPARNIPGGEFGLIFIAVVIYLFFAFPSIVKRLHDLNNSGTIAILLLVPMVGLFGSIWLLVSPGSYGENDYGFPSKLVLSKNNEDHIESAQ